MILRVFTLIATPCFASSYYYSSSSEFSSSSKDVNGRRKSEAFTRASEEKKDFDGTVSTKFAEREIKDGKLVYAKKANCINEDCDSQVTHHDISPHQITNV
jgi:hypothetical protein